MRLDQLPNTVAEFEAMAIDNRGGAAALDWTLQTYLRLKEAGCPDIVLTGEVPSRGMVVAHADAFQDKRLNEQRRIYKIALQGDRMQPVQADVYVVQNPTDPKVAKHKAHFVPFLPQYNLVKRTAGRGVEKIGYFGWQQWQAWPLQTQEFADSMAAIGISLDYRFEDRRAEWHDYSEIDLILAVRSFDGNPYVNKPATKLFNAWQAETPAILGAESAFQALKRSDLDYIEIKSKSEAVKAAKQLKENPQLYAQMVENGRQRAAEFSTETILQKWLAFIASVRGARRWFRFWKR